MDKRLWPLAMRIAYLENFAVQLRAIHPLSERVVDPGGYDYVNRAPDTYTVKRWMKNRLQKKFPYLSGWIVDRGGRRLEDHDLIILAKDTSKPIEILWCENLGISFSGSDPGIFDLFVPFLRAIDADITPVAKRFLRGWVMNAITPPVILYGFEYEKFKECLYRAADANGVKFKSRRKERDGGDFFVARTFEELLRALGKFAGINIEQDSGEINIRPFKRRRREKFCRKFKPNYDRKRVENMCNDLKNGTRGVILGREILGQLDQGFLNQSTYERLSRWVNPQKPEPNAQKIATEISVLLFGKKISRTS